MLILIEYNFFINITNMVFKSHLTTTVNYIYDITLFYI